MIEVLNVQFKSIELQHAGFFALQGLGTAGGYVQPQRTTPKQSVEH